MALDCMWIPFLISVNNHGVEWGLIFKIWSWSYMFRNCLANKIVTACCKLIHYYEIDWSNLSFNATVKKTTYATICMMTQTCDPSSVSFSGIVCNQWKRCLKCFASLKCFMLKVYLLLCLFVFFFFHIEILMILFKIPLCVILIIEMK